MKFSRLACALLLCFGMAAPALAAPSVNTITPMPDVSTFQNSFFLNSKYVLLADGAGAGGPLSGLFQYTAGSCTDDGGISVVKNGGNCYLRLRAGTVPCLGVDDTSAFAAAISTVGVGGTIYTPPSTTCLITGLTASVASQTLSVVHSSLLKLKSGSCSSSVMITVTATYFTVSGSGTIDGNRANCAKSIAIKDVSGTGHHLTVSGTDGQRLTIQNTGSYGISLLDAQDVTIQHVYLTSTGNMPIFANRTASNNLPNYLIDDILIDRTAETDPNTQGGAINLRNDDNASDFTYGYTNARMTNIQALGPAGDIASTQGIGVHGGTNLIYANNHTKGWLNGHSVNGCNGCSITGNVAENYFKKAFEFGHLHKTTATGNVGLSGPDISSQYGGCVSIVGESNHFTLDGQNCGLTAIAPILATPTKGEEQLLHMTISNAMLYAPAGKECVNLAGTFYFIISDLRCDGLLGDASSEGIHLRGKAPDKNFKGWITGTTLWVTDVHSEHKYDPPYPGYIISGGGTTAGTVVLSATTCTPPDVFPTCGIDDSGVGSYVLDRSTAPGVVGNAGPDLIPLSPGTTYCTPPAVPPACFDDVTIELTGTLSFPVGNHGQISGSMNDLNRAVTIEDAAGSPSVADYFDINLQLSDVTTPFLDQFSFGSTLGTHIKLCGVGIFAGTNATSTCYSDFANRVLQAKGSGSPEGNVTGGIGSTYQDFAGAVGFQFYLKELGTGNTGWAAIPSINSFAAPFGGMGSVGQYAPVEMAGTNVLTYSNTFDNAAWSRTDANAPTQTVTHTAPDGTTNAWSVTSTAAGGAIYQSVAVTPSSTVVRAASVWFDGTSTSQVFTIRRSYMGGAGGTVIYTARWNNATSTMTTCTTLAVCGHVSKVIDGVTWHRIWLASVDPVGDATTSRMTIFVNDSTGATSTVSIFGAQSEVILAGKAICTGTDPRCPTSYIPTTSAAVTRPVGMNPYILPAIAPFVITPSSANLAALLSDETGSGPDAFSVSPAFTGSPTAPTQAANDNSTKLATTAYVDTVRTAQVANVTSLRALTTSLFSPDTMYLKQFAGTAGWGGGYVYYDTNDTTTADDGCTVFVDASSRRWKRAISIGSAIDVTWCGAVGDNSATTVNDTALTAAIAAAVASNHRAVFFPAGTYLLATQQIIDGVRGLRFYGVGAKPNGSSSVSTLVYRGNPAVLTTTGDTHTTAVIDGIASTSTVTVGQLVTASGFPSGTIVESKTSTSLTLSNASSSSLSGTAVVVTKPEGLFKIISSTDIAFDNLDLAASSVGGSKDSLIQLTAHKISNLSSFGISFTNMYFHIFSGAGVFGVAALDLRNCGNIVIDNSIFLSATSSSSSDAIRVGDNSTSNTGTYGAGQCANVTIKNSYFNGDIIHRRGDLLNVENNFFNEQTGASPTRIPVIRADGDQLGRSVRLISNYWPDGSFAARARAAYTQGTSGYGLIATGNVIDGNLIGFDIAGLGDAVIEENTFGVGAHSTTDDIGVNIGASAEKVRVGHNKTTVLDTAGGEAIVDARTTPESLESGQIGELTQVAGSLWVKTTATGKTGWLKVIDGAGAVTATNLTTSAYTQVSVGNALTAAGTTRADALQLAKQVNRVTTAAAGTGVILPVGVVGMRIVVFNSGANPIKVYASASEAIDGTAGSTGVTLTNALRCEYIYVAANVWVSAQMGAVSG